MKTALKHPIIVKNTIQFIVTLFITTLTFAQQGINYKAIITDNGNVLVTQPVTVQFTILENGTTAVYRENHSTTTDAHGIIILNIGEGTVTLGNYTSIDWADEQYLKVEINTGSGFIDFGTTAFKAVPYAHYANFAANAGAHKIDDLSDAKSDTDGSSVFLGIDAGLNDDGSNNENVGLGYKSLFSNTIGYGNTANGFQSLYSNTTGNNNTANGFQSLFLNSTGNENTANGIASLYWNTTGHHNTAIGSHALLASTTGNYNSANGSSSLYLNTTGSWNTANGNYSLYSNTTGNYNTANGNYSLSSNVAGNNATAIGTNAMRYTNNSSTAFTNYNVALGYEALRGSTNASNNTGNWNTALGYQTLLNNSTGEKNTANGTEALYSNTTGFENTANGYGSLYTNTTGEKNTANGAQALYSNSTGNFNTASGFLALYYNTIGYKNTSNGFGSLYYNVAGNNATAIGAYAMCYSYDSSIGFTNYNVAVGYEALRGSNTAIGYQTLLNNTSGSYNTANSYQALSSNTTGSYNTANGNQALTSNTTGNFNTAIGFSAFSTGSGYSNATALGYNAEPGASNTVRIGNNAVTSIGGYANWTNVSDGRFKKNVQENVIGLEFIKKLRPVTYQLDMNAIADFNKTPDSLRLPESERLKEAEIQSGFIAQEVEAAALSTGYDFHGVDKPQNDTSHYGLRYAEFVVPLVKAVQEQQEQIELLKKENQALKDSLAQMTALEKRIQQLESK